MLSYTLVLIIIGVVDRRSFNALTKSYDDRARDTASDTTTTISYDTIFFE
jgi:hypothetical protein